MFKLELYILSGFLFSFHVTLFLLITVFIYLCRDFKGGEPFYMMPRTINDAFHTFMAIHECVIGSLVIIFEPSLEDNIYGVPLIKTETSLLPFKHPFKGSTSLKKQHELLASNDQVFTFVYETENIVFTRPRIENGCGSKFCDSKHLEETTCPSLSSTTMVGKTMAVEVGLPDFGLVNLAYRSCKLADLFFTGSLLTVIY